jgi:hypothetical protein
MRGRVSAFKFKGSYATGRAARGVYAYTIDAVSGDLFIAFNGLSRTTFARSVPTRCSSSPATANWLWMVSSSRLWGRHANVDSPASGSGPTITAGWHTLVRVWDGQQVRQYVDSLRTNTTAVTAAGSWAGRGR